MVRRRLSGSLCARRMGTGEQRAQNIQPVLRDPVFDLPVIDHAECLIVAHEDAVRRQCMRGNEHVHGPKADAFGVVVRAQDGIGLCGNAIPWQHVNAQDEFFDRCSEAMRVGTACSTKAQLRLSVRGNADLLHRDVLEPLAHLRWGASDDVACCVGVQ